MKYSIKVNEVKTKEDSNIRGFATVVFGDSFKVTNIAILENRQKGTLFVSMPRYKSNEKDESGATVYKDVCNPITAEFREELYNNILEAYEKVNTEDKGALVADPEVEDAPSFSVRVTPIEKEGSSIRGFARVYLNDSFIVNNVSILEGKNGLFIAQPSYKTSKVDDKGNNVYQDICYPVTKEFREQLYKQIIDTYKEEKEKRKAEAEEKVKEKAKEQEKKTSKKKEEKR